MNGPIVPAVDSHLLRMPCAVCERSGRGALAGFEDEDRLLNKVCAHCIALGDAENAGYEVAPETWRMLAEFFAIEMLAPEDDEGDWSEWHAAHESFGEKWA
jgi:hypothetical protein